MRTVAKTLATPYNSQFTGSCIHVGINSTGVANLHCWQLLQCMFLQVRFSLNRKRVSYSVKNKAMVSYTSYHMFYHVFQDRGSLFWWHAIIINLCSQDEVHLTAPCAGLKPTNLNKCILCQKKKPSKYLSSGEVGRSNIVLLAKKAESSDTQATRVVQLTMQEQGMFKYHASFCYRNFQREMARFDIVTSHPLEQAELSQQEPGIDVSERRSKRFKPNVPSNICIFCSADRITVRQKTIHTLYKVSEKPMAQKLLNAGVLFRDHVYTETAAMCDVGDVFAADIL